MEQRTVDIVFDDALDGFKIHALDGRPGHVIESKGWPVYFDGHGGLYAIVMAPREERAFLERLFLESFSGPFALNEFT